MQNQLGLIVSWSLCAAIGIATHDHVIDIFRSQIEGQTEMASILLQGEKMVKKVPNANRSEQVEKSTSTRPKKGPPLVNQGLELALGMQVSGELRKQHEALVKNQSTPDLGNATSMRPPPVETSLDSQGRRNAVIALRKARSLPSETNGSDSSPEKVRGPNATKEEKEAYQLSSKADSNWPRNISSHDASENVMVTSTVKSFASMCWDEINDGSSQWVSLILFLFTGITKSLGKLVEVAAENPFGMSAIGTLLLLGFALLKEIRELKASNAELIDRYMGRPLQLDSQWLGRFYASTLSGTMLPWQRDQMAEAVGGRE